MKSLALQELIKKIFSDEKTRLQFNSNPDSVLSQYAISDEEKKAVLSTHAKLGLVTSDSSQLEAAIDPYGVWHAPPP